MMMEKHVELKVKKGVPSFQKEETPHSVLEGINIKYCDSKEYKLS